MNLFFGNQVTTAGGTYSDLGSMYTDYTYRQALKQFFLRYYHIFKKITAILPTPREHVTWTWRQEQSTRQLVNCQMMPIALLSPSSMVIHHLQECQTY